MSAELQFFSDEKQAHHDEIDIPKKSFFRSTLFQILVIGLFVFIVSRPSKPSVLLIYGNSISFLGPGLWYAFPQREIGLAVKL
jgi:hypothetical protein